MQFLKNIDYNNIDKGIEFLKKNELKFHLSDNEETIYHVYWYGEIKRKQICCINSYLATQDLSNTKLWVWLDYETFELSENKVPNIIISLLKNMYQILKQKIHYLKESKLLTKINF